MIALTCLLDNFGHFLVKQHSLLLFLAAAQVNDNYLDARSSGWDRTRWAQLRDEALAKRYSDTPTVHR